MMKAFLSSILLFWPLVASATTDSLRTTPTCRCTAEDPSCWPSSAAFAELERNLSSPLIYPVPPASACYPVSSPSGNCSDVQENWSDGLWRADQPGAMQEPNFETYIWQNGTASACYQNVSIGLSCEQGSVPVVGVDAREVGDIQAAVKFATSNNLRIVVKNTGHDYLGRSTARGSFVIWTHQMKNLTYNASFTLQGSPDAEEHFSAIMLSAGVQWFEAYAEAQKHNRIVVGGISPGGSVGAAGGWVQGGGHSILSPLHGLGVDNVLEMTIVIASGEHLTANQYLNSDLFWTLRGGGGGTYGVVTSVTYRTHPALTVIGTFFSASSNNSNAVHSLLTEIVRTQPELTDAGWAGYGFGLANTLWFLYLMPNATLSYANATLQPLFSFAQNLTSQGLEIQMASITPYDSFYEWYSDIASDPSGGNGANIQIGSHLIPRDLFDNAYQNVSDVLFNLGSYSWNAVAGGKVSEIDPDSVGLNPAWRKALLHVTFGQTWPEGAAADDIDSAIDLIKQGLKSVHKLAPDSGAYFNEASLYEEDPQGTFFGAHYEQLAAIKAKYDPGSSFLVQGGVGSEYWDKDLRCPL
ncbi:hypothetical protein HYDPIDRAFT_115467 [Hydnomerulius pinastri MD-312]|uniref:FAD-binding PCMH-type domain-containing protein n=1 Tax=Hydnomerulius pinastri MD-312 TaxID=994086 RepID=A0A0C9V7T8_9AGAM|nr:hypothetical protein HYDPIDRAFT_115467 [Hydnomerulius pinastri MD-312]